MLLTIKGKKDSIGGAFITPTDLLNVDEDTPLYQEWKMSEEDIAFLQRIAWETVADYLGFE